MALRTSPLLVSIHSIYIMSTCIFTLLVIIKSQVPSLYYTIFNSKSTRTHHSLIVYQWKVSSMLFLLAFLSICFDIHMYDIVTRSCITQMFYEKTLISFKLVSYELHLLEYGSNHTCYRDYNHVHFIILN